MKRVFSIIIILGLGSTVSAQDSYTGRDRITADGITFLASVYQGVILSLANITNTRENAPEVYKDGSPIEPEFVSFTIDYVPCMLAIPPSKFALLEKNLKRYVKWDVNLFGRKLQFMHGMSFVNFSKIRLQYPSSEPEIPDLTVPTGPRNPGDEALKPAPWN